MLALTSQTLALQIMNIPLPTKEERERLRKTDRAIENYWSLANDPIRPRVRQSVSAPEMAEQTGTYVSFQAEGKLLAKVAGQSKVAPLITKGGLKANGHNLSIGLNSGPVGSAIQIAK
jgi:hypothetical protein